MTENQTSAFLGSPYSWSKTKIELDDVQPLHGGIRVYLPNWTTGQAFVIRVAPGGKETRYKILLWNREKEKLCRLCVEHDFLTIQPENRPGVPDEARPTISLTNPAGETHTIAKWAGIQDERFDTIYAALRQIGEQTKGKRPIPEKARPYQKILFILGLILSVLAILLLTNRAANAIAASWWPAHPGRLAGLTALLLAGLPLVLFGLRLRERDKPRYDRMGANPFFLLLLNLLFWTGVITLPSFLWRTAVLWWGETAVASWPLLSRFSLPENNLAANDHAIWLLTAILAIYLLTLGAGLAGPAIMPFIDERF